MSREPDLSPEESELTIYSFIIKIWVEEVVSREAKYVEKWHGQITDVPGGASKHIKDLGEIELFILEKLRLPKRG